MLEKLQGFSLPIKFSVEKLINCLLQQVLHCPGVMTSTLNELDKPSQVCWSILEKSEIS